MPLADVNGTGIFFTEAGHGEPCLTMHGGLGFDHSYLTPGLDVLGDAMHLIYFDHRCNGRSGRPPIDTLTFAQLAEDADALRASLGHQEITILGHSVLGCAVALEYALRFPQRLGRLILVCAAPRFNADDPALGERLARKGMTTEMAEAFAHAGESDAAFRRYTEVAGPLYHHEFDGARYRCQIGGMVYSAAALARSLELAATWEITERLAAVTTPTLLIAGGSDPFATPEDSLALRDGIPDAELVVLGASGHFPWMEQPAEFVAAIKAWIQRDRYPQV